MRKTVYLDATILSYLYDEREEIKSFVEITIAWFKKYSNTYDLFLSEETLRELGTGDYPKKDKVIETALGIKILPVIPEIITITQYYIDNHLMPRILQGDALHLAIASYYKIDFILTWNCKHLANANKKLHIRVINNRLGLFVPEITTPMELVNEEDDHA